MSNEESYVFSETEEPVDIDEIAEEIDSMLQSSGRLFVKNERGRRFLVSVSIELVPSDEE